MVLGGLTITERAEARLELAVGVLIVLFGARVLWRLRREKVHLHVHSHGQDRHVHCTRRLRPIDFGDFASM